MNTTSTDFKFFLDNDSNPFILFSNKGAVLYLNSSAEMLMGIHTERKIFELALMYAPKSFGFKTTLLDIGFNSFEFYSINVLYSNDDEIGIHLYIKPRIKTGSQSTLEGYTNTDINLLLQANIELFNIDYNGKLSLFTDYELPEMQLHQNNFSMLLRKALEQFGDSKSLNIELKLKIGTKIVVGEKSYPIAVLRLDANKRSLSHDISIKKLSIKNHISPFFQSRSIAFEIPVIYS